MEYRPFGKTGIDVSAIGYGCWEMSGGYGSFDKAEIVAAANRAIDLGINCFDTAEDYGKGASEEVVFEAVGHRRDEIVLVTKFGIGYDNERPRGRDAGREMAHAAIDRSLKRLGTDYVDAFLVHWPDRATPFEETMAALDEIVQAGKARAIGLSNFTLDEIKECMAVRRVDVLQYGYNMFDRRMSREIFDYAREHDIAMMTYGSLAYGLLAGAFNEDTEFERNDWRRGGGGGFSLRLFADDVFRRNLKVVDGVKEIAERLGKSLPELALNWTLSHPAVSTGLVGARRVTEVDANMGALGWTLGATDRAAIDAVFDQYEVNTAPNKWVESID